MKRTIEIYCVTSIAPIPMATMANREWGQMGQNYLRSLLALGFQGFILSLCELIVGGKDGLMPVEKTIIDRCVRSVYREYLSDPRPEKMPIFLYDKFHIHFPEVFFRYRQSRFLWQFWFSRLLPLKMAFRLIAGVKLAFHHIPLRICLRVYIPHIIEESV